MNHKKAFTLSEVLITLMLIGVIAALTIPIFMEEFQKNKWTVTFKRTFAETFNALGRVALEEECSKSLTCTHIFDGAQNASTEDFGKAMTSVMVTSKICGMEKIAKTPSEGEAPEADPNGCFTHKIRKGLASTESETLIDTMMTDIPETDDTPFYTFITQRGVAYALFSFGENCLNGNVPQKEAWYNAYVTSPDIDNNQMLSLCGFIIVDVNGKQSPNIWGRDVFGVWVTDRSVIGVYPFGGDYDKRFGNNNESACGGGLCCKDDGTDARGCAARIIKDGWVMKY